MSMTYDKLHLGCGLTTPDGWVNLDGSWNAWFAKHPRLRGVIRRFHLLPASQLDIPWSPDILIHDVRKGLPFADNSMRAIYGAHFLEHLYRNEADALLRECYRILKPRGIVRMVVPDLESILGEYGGETPFGELSAQRQDLPPAEIVNQRLLLRDPEAPNGSLPYRLYNALNDFTTHKWMYDGAALEYHFAQAGFVDVGTRKYLDSGIKEIAEVEEASRVVNGAGVCVEGYKPG